MKRLTYIPDYNKSKSHITEEIDTINRVFEKDYQVSLLEIDFEDPLDHAMDQIEDFVQDMPDLVIANGLACFFAVHYCAECHCICLNPRVAPEDIPDELFDEYDTLRISRLQLDQLHQRYDKISYGIYAVKDIKDDRLTMSYFYPFLTAAQDTTITQDFVKQTIAPIVELLNNYEWYDEFGVHYTKCGRVIDGVQRDIFESCTEFKMPDSVRGIRPAVFERSNLERVVFNDYLEEIPPLCFAGSIHLKIIDFSNSSGLCKISEDAFRGCTSLRCNLNLRQTNVFTIGSNAFCGTNIEVAKLPNSLKHCQANAFPDRCRIVVSRQKLEDMLRGL